MSERPHDRREFTAWNEEMVRRFDPGAYHTRSPLPIRAIERLRVRAIAKLLDAAPTSRVLEVGCGGGNVLERVPGRRVGIDLSPFIVKKAHQPRQGRQFTVERVIGIPSRLMPLRLVARLRPR